LHDRPVSQNRIWRSFYITEQFGLGYLKTRPLCENSFEFRSTQAHSITTGLSACYARSRELEIVSASEYGSLWRNVVKTIPFAIAIIPLAAGPAADLKATAFSTMRVIPSTMSD
jgi:hypothetical protein